MISGSLKCHPPTSSSSHSAFLSLFQWAGRLQPQPLSALWREPLPASWSKVNSHITIFSREIYTSFPLSENDEPPQAATSHSPALPQPDLISSPKSFSPSNASQMFAKVSSLISHLRECYCPDAPACHGLWQCGFVRAESGEKLHAAWCQCCRSYVRCGEEKGSECEVQENDCTAWLCDLLVVPPLPLMNDTQGPERRMLWSPLVSRYIKVFMIPCPSLTSAVIPTNPACS